jgi:hypothetical protein
MAVGNSAKEVVSFAGDIAKRSVKGVHKIGKVFVRHANNAVRNVTNKRRRRKWNALAYFTASEMP